MKRIIKVTPEELKRRLKASKTAKKNLRRVDEPKDR
jgi:hypothetical protein